MSYRQNDDVKAKRGVIYCDSPDEDNTWMKVDCKEPFSGQCGSKPVK